MVTHRNRVCGLTLGLAGVLAIAPTARAADPAVDIARRLASQHHLGAALTVLARARVGGGGGAADADALSVDRELARLQDAAGQHPESLRAWRAVQADRPGDPEALAGEAKELAWLGRIDDAQTLVDRVLADPRASTDDRARVRVVRLGLDAVRAQRAGPIALLQYAVSVKPTLDAIASEAPGTPEVLLAEGRFHLQAPPMLGGDPSRAVQDLDAGVRAAPWNPRILAWDLAAHQAAGQPIAAQVQAFRRDYADVPSALHALDDALANRMVARAHGRTSAPAVAAASSAASEAVSAATGTRRESWRART